MDVICLPFGEEAGSIEIVNRDGLGEFACTPSRRISP